ncbi:hypothetical protein BN889_00314 [Pseudomonas aeruginosa PA38182]|nr:hypothetical protein BN889_00314 [Pseudomonas aeruginosa PA38182]
MLDRLIQERVLNPDRVIAGMLHPSGNCTYRINYLIGDRSALVPHATSLCLTTRSGEHFGSGSSPPDRTSDDVDADAGSIPKRE